MPVKKKLTKKKITFSLPIILCDRLTKLSKQVDEPISVVARALLEYSLLHEAEIYPWFCEKCGARVHSDTEKCHVCGNRFKGFFRSE